MNRQEIQRLRDWGEQDPVIQSLKSSELQPNIFITGRYTTATMNWCYYKGIAKIGSSYYELLTQFGAVIGGRLINIPSYSLRDIKVKKEAKK